MRVSNNRLWNCKNPNQGIYRRVLCVCSAGLLRSPTIAYVLSQDPYNFNTRACGADVGHALIPIDEVLLEWADMVICVETEIAIKVKEMLKAGPGRVMPTVYVWNVPDRYEFRDPALVEIIRAIAEETWPEFSK